MKKSEKLQLFLFGCALTGMGLAVAYSLKNKDNETQNQSLSRLEQFAEQDGKKGLSIVEEAKMYDICGVGDKPKNYVLTQKDIEKGIEVYESEIKNKNYQNGKGE